jgi:hypothetical protein
VKLGVEGRAWVKSEEGQEIWETRGWASWALMARTAEPEFWHWRRRAEIPWMDGQSALTRRGTSSGRLGHLGSLCRFDISAGCCTARSLKAHSMRVMRTFPRFSTVCRCHEDAAKELVRARHFERSLCRLGRAEVLLKNCWHRCNLGCLASRRRSPCRNQRGCSINLRNDPRASPNREVVVSSTQQCQHSSCPLLLVCSFCPPPSSTTDAANNIRWPRFE